MKLACALFRYFPFGGLQLDFLRIAQEMLRRGHQVTLICGDCEGELPEGLRVVRLPLTSCTNHGRAAEFEKAFPAAAEGADLKLGFNRIAGLDYYFAGDECLKRNALLKYPSFFLSLVPRYRTFLRQENAVLGPASKTKVFTIAETQKNDFIRFYNTPEERLIELPPGIDGIYRRTSDLEALRIQCRKELGISEDETLLIQVGNVLKVKGFDRTFYAIDALPEELKSKCRFLIVGAVDAEKCRSMAEKAHIPLILTGAVSDVRKYLAGADLMVHPARRESAGSVLVEAIASGLPVLCSGICGFAPYVEKSGGIALSAHFGQGDLNTALRNILHGGLEQMKIKVLQYRTQCDFYRRAAVVADTLEAAVRC